MAIFRTTLISNLAALSIGLLLVGCNSIGIHPTGDEYEQTHTVSDINAMDLWGAGELTLENGNRDELVIIAQEKVHQNLEVYVRNNTLHVGPKKGVHFRLSGNQKIQYILIRDNIEKIELSGATTLIAPDYSVGRMAIDASGASELDIQLNTGTLTLDGSGATDGYISGTADDFYVDISGASDINAIDFKVKTATIEVSGASTMRVNVSDLLDVSASGASDVTYLGQPRVRINTSGASNVNAE
jgi:hypothetical protein